VPHYADIRAASEKVTAELIGWSGHDFLLLHVVMKRLGQLICHDTKPECALCPLASDCPGAGRS